MNKISTLMIAIIVSGLFAIGLVSVMLQGADFYDVPLDSNYTSFYSDINKTVNDTSGLGNLISGKLQKSEDIGLIGTVELIFKGIWEIIKLPLNMIKIITTSFEFMGLALDIPAWILTIFLSIVTITIVFVVLSAFHRWRI